MSALQQLQQAFILTPDQLGNMLAAIPLLPLMGATVNGLFGRRLGHERAAFIATSALMGAFVASIAVFVQLLKGSAELHTDVYRWFAAGGLDVQLGLSADHLSGILLLVITGIGSLIHLYSSSYMSHDPHSWRYFAYLNLFVSAMLLLVLGDNLVTLFVGWEGVGLCSYLLIGFWFTDDQKASAGKKAFITNRVGDFAFLIGMFTLYSLFGTLNVRELKAASAAVEARSAQVGGEVKKGYETPVSSGIFASSSSPAAPDAAPARSYHFVVGLALLCLFIGATGKSAQIPLYVWLPDAMAGPTPVSALIHAATMVTAGIYMMSRLSFFYVHVPEVLAVAAVVGVLTALFAALMAFGQNDIKKVLAYSTVSQLGFMFVGVGAGAFWAGTYHLFTHAFFKACLFLGSGAVIHGLHEEQDIRNMGGLKKYMPHTRWTFLIATATIAGIVPFSGFFSKDEILHLAQHSPVLHHVWAPLGMIVYVLGSITALCTAFYMFRLYFLTFEGEYRGHAHPHESPVEMTLPLWVLAIGSIVAAALAFPIGHGAWESFGHGVYAQYPSEHAADAGVPWAAFGIALVIGWAGFFAAWRMYGKGMASPDADPLFTGAPAFANASANKFWVDELYQAVIIKPLWALARLAHKFVDALVIDRVLVNGAAEGTSFLSRVLSPFQNGDLSRYAALTALAVAGLLFWAIL